MEKIIGSSGFKKAIVVILVIAVFVGGFFIGFGEGKKVPDFFVVKGVTNVDDPMGDPPADFGLFWQAWRIIENEYIRDDVVSPKDKVYGAISGLVNSLGDDYSQFFSPDEGEKFSEDIRGNFGGIGAEIGIRDNRLVVIAPLKNTPASQADLRAEDIILEINSTSTNKMTVDEAVSLIRGEIGTEVVLTIFRDGWDEPREIAITRGNIVIPTLNYEIRDDGIVYADLYSFNANANDLFQDAMTKALAGGSRGLILDLRNNPGGFLQVAVDLAGWFVPQGELVVKEVSPGMEPLEFRANGNATLVDFPVVVLVNGGSASASEILAGALRDNQGIKLVGTETFGKGSVQQIKYLPDGSSMKLTTAYWELPSGKKLIDGGLEPDYEVELESDGVEESDLQLDRAIEIIKAEIQN